MEVIVKMLKKGEKVRGEGDVYIQRMEVIVKKKKSQWGGGGGGVRVDVNGEVKLL